ncbi:MAG TPA: hypothetical protein VHP58_04210 [Alphaproteobacteria bacterium]|nr:hypothetical protein [Alphaproteobacteria bacterium]
MKLNTASEHVATEDDLRNLKSRFGIGPADIARALNLPVPVECKVVGNTLVPQTRKRIPLPRILRFEQSPPLVINIRRLKK